jgi:hypothetical protein
VSETRSTAIGIEILYVELQVGINMSASYFKKGSLVTIPINFRHNREALHFLVEFMIRVCSLRQTFLFSEV